MQKVAVLAAALVVLACAKAKAEKKPLSEAGEKVYTARSLVGMLQTIPCGSITSRFRDTWRP